MSINSKIQKLINSLYNRRTEIHYNERYVNTKEKPIKINLQGKIKCPIVNTGISSIVCSTLMDKPDWPRNIDPDVCKRCECFIYLSIKKFKVVKTPEVQNVQQK